MDNGSRQVVVLAGGLGTRLGALGLTRPKILQEVLGQPFIDFMLYPLVRRGFRRYVLCLGHFAEEIIGYLDDRWPDLKLTVHVDSEPQGTGGSLCAAVNVLDPEFLVVLGDTYFDIDYGGMFATLGDYTSGVMAVTNADTGVPANVGVVGDRIARYEKSTSVLTHWTDSGAAVLRRSALDLIADAPAPVDLGALFRALIARDALRARFYVERFHDIGTPGRLAEFTDFIAQDPALRSEVGRSASRRTTRSDRHCHPR